MTGGKLLWVGDAFCDTGFSTVSTNVLARLASLGWDCLVLAVNWYGDPHESPYRAFPARVNPYQDQAGSDRLAEICFKEKPDIVLLNSDPCVIVRHCIAAKKAELETPLVAYMPVDSLNFGRKTAATLSAGLRVAVWYCRFGLEQAALAGYRGRSAIIPHGVDLDLFKPVDKADARKQMLHESVPRDAFIVGNINRNSPRKRMDLTIEAFAMFKQSIKEDRPVYLYLHAGKDDDGWRLEDLADYYGVADRLLLAPPMKRWVKGIPKEAMKLVYSMLDVHISTTIGEGWGMSSHESLACGIPNIVPDFAALGEWCKSDRLGQPWFVPVHESATFCSTNQIYKVPDVNVVAALLKDAYDFGSLPNAESCRAFVDRPEWKWQAIGEQFDKVLKGTLGA